MKTNPTNPQQKSVSEWHFICLDCDMKAFKHTYPESCPECGKSKLIITDLRWRGRARNNDDG